MTHVVTAKFPSGLSQFALSSRSQADLRTQEAFATRSVTRRVAKVPPAEDRLLAETFCVVLQTLGKCPVS